MKVKIDIVNRRAIEDHSPCSLPTLGECIWWYRRVNESQEVEKTGYTFHRNNINRIFENERRKLNLPCTELFDLFLARNRSTERCKNDVRLVQRLTKVCEAVARRQVIGQRLVCSESWHQQQTPQINNNVSVLTIKAPSTLTAVCWVINWTEGGSIRTYWGQAWHRTLRHTNTN